MLRRLTFRTLIVALAGWLGLSTAVVVPFVFAIPVAAVIGLLHPVRIQVPPIASGS